MIISSSWAALYNIFLYVHSNISFLGKKIGTINVKIGIIHLNSTQGSESQVHDDILSIMFKRGLPKSDLWNGSNSKYDTCSLEEILENEKIY